MAAARRTCTPSASVSQTSRGRIAGPCGIFQRPQGDERRVTAGVSCSDATAPLRLRGSRFDRSVVANRGGVRGVDKNVGPVDSIVMVLLLCASMFLFLGLPVIVPTVFLVRKQQVLERPRLFWIVAFVVCVLIQRANRLSESAILAAGGLTFLKTQGQETSMLWSALVPWLLEAFLAVQRVRRLGRLLSTPS